MGRAGGVEGPVASSRACSSSAAWKPPLRMLRRGAGSGKEDMLTARTTPRDSISPPGTATATTPADAAVLAWHSLHKHLHLRWRWPLRRRQTRRGV